VEMFESCLRTIVYDEPTCWRVVFCAGSNVGERSCGGMACLRAVACGKLTCLRAAFSERADVTYSGDCRCFRVADLCVRWHR